MNHFNEYPRVQKIVTELYARLNETCPVVSHNPYAAITNLMEVFTSVINDYVKEMDLTDADKRLYRIRVKDMFSNHTMVGFSRLKEKAKSDKPSAILKAAGMDRILNQLAYSLVRATRVAAQQKASDKRRERLWRQTRVLVAG